jgi:hypothetical protein
MSVQHEDQLGTTQGLEALVAMGYSGSEARRIVERWGTWQEFRASSWEERAHVVRRRGYAVLPHTMPAVRETEIGEAVAYLDHRWPRELDKVGEALCLIEVGGRLPTRSIAVSGAQWPSGAGIEIARSVAAAACTQGLGIIAVEGGVAAAALETGRELGQAVSILYGDSPLVEGRGCVGGVMARYRSRGSSARIHLRGTGSESDGLRLGTQVAVALAEAVVIIEPGTGRTPGFEAEWWGRTWGRRVIVVNGDSTRGDGGGSRAGELAKALEELRSLS